MLVGALIAILSFVCSVGNIPLAAILWAGGISFSGVIAFIYADLVTLPIILIYRKYYGGRFAIKLTALMLGTMVADRHADLLFREPLAGELAERGARCLHRCRRALDLSHEPVSQPTGLHQAGSRSVSVIKT